jgi:hypothetical protein
MINASRQRNSLDNITIARRTDLVVELSSPAALQKRELFSQEQILRNQGNSGTKHQLKEFQQLCILVWSKYS